MNVFSCSRHFLCVLITGKMRGAGEKMKDTYLYNFP